MHSQLENIIETVEKHGICTVEYTIPFSLENELKVRGYKVTKISVFGFGNCDVHEITKQK